MTTLREVLDSTPLLDTLTILNIVEAWAYGTETECLCDNGRLGTGFHLGEYPCPSCHGTGTKRGPGLVERVVNEVPWIRECAPGEEPVVVLLAVLRAELGETP